MTASLSDADLAKAEVDLPSWILQDDAAVLQDFCFGAKDMHSTSPCDPGYASPPFIPFQDLPDWMESKDDFCINGFQKSVNSPVQGNENYLDSAVLEDFSDNPNDLIKMEMEQQQKLEFLQFGDELDEIPIIEHDLHGAGLPTQQQQQAPLLAPSVHVPILFDASDDFSEILPSQLPVSTDPSSTSSFVEYQQPEMTHSKPMIISVSLSEAVNYKAEEQQVFNSVPAVTTETLSGTASVSSSSNNIMMMNVAPNTAAGHKQQPLVINLKKVRVTPKPAPVAPPQPTLKDVLTSDEADSFIKELITLPCYSPEHATEEEGGSPITVEASIDGDYSSDEDGSSQASDSASESSYDPSSSSVRYAPYSSMERKLRKKEQNKRAALRYRQKKKNEEESIMGVMRGEQEKQKELVEKCNALQMEVKMMKRLMKDMLIAKGKL